MSAQSVRRLKRSQVYSLALAALGALASCDGRAPVHEGTAPSAPESSLVEQWFVVTPGEIASLDEGRIGKVGFPGRPEPLRRRALELPEGSEATERAAVFVVEAIVGTSGNVVKARLMAGPEVEGLERRLIECLQEWRFRPASYEGEAWAVSWLITLPVPDEESGASTRASDVSVSE